MCAGIHRSTKKSPNVADELRKAVALEYESHHERLRHVSAYLTVATGECVDKHARNGTDTANEEASSYDPNL
jgi:hypothetical protein